MKTKLLLLYLFLAIFICGYSQNNRELPKTSQKYIRFQHNTTSSGALTSFANHYKLQKQTTFQQVSSNVDREGFTHEKFQQYYKGIKVEFGTAIIHSFKNNVYLVNGELYQADTSTAQLNNDSAFNKAVNYVNATTYLWESVLQSKLMKYKKPEGELVYLPNIETGIATLAYKFDIFALEPLSRQEIYVSTTNGEVLLVNPIMKHSHNLDENKQQLQQKQIESILLAVPGNAATRYNGTQTIETTFNGTEYTLQDTTRGNGIFTYNCEDTNTYQDVDFTDNDNNWTALEHNNADKDNGALDAHWGAEVTYDFWQNIFARNSYDDNGAALKSYVHFGNFNNASWNGSAMTYGDGTGSLDIFTALDICGHEIGHAVCNYTANLVYQNESGAMNEGFSDIWGACIEHYGRTGGLNAPYQPAVWLIGEDIGATLRSMQNPNAYGDPDTYGGTNWYTGTGDNGGVHTNSGVLNHWFYIITEGASGTNNAPVPDTYNVTGIGMAKASEIAYLAERDYLTPNATYADARLATLEVVNNLYCANSPEAIAVTNAWYAVNVGEQYTSVADDIAVKSVQEDASIPCSNTTFTTAIILKNQGTNTITSATIEYSVDGGTPNSIPWTGNLASCNETSIPLTINGLSRGTHELIVTSSIPNDGRPENNSKATTFFINDAGTVNTTNTFSAIADELIVYNDEGTTPWIRANRISGSMSTGGNLAYMINNTGNYPDMNKAYLVSQCYDLSVLSSPQISFLMKYDLELNWDIVYVEYSTNFGANWSVLGTMGANWYNSDRTLASSGGADCYNCPGAQWTGSNTTNTTYSYPLTALNSETNVIFRIVFHSDQAVTALGVNIDDFLISGTLSSNSFENNNFISVYPVPSKGIFNVNYGTTTPEKIEVYDLTGKIILTKESFSSEETMLDLTSVSNGIYFVKIQFENQNVVKRIIKE